MFEGYVKEVRRQRPGILIGVFAALPMVSANDIRLQFVEWDRRGCRPDFLRMDVDPGRRDALTAAQFTILRNLCDDRGIPLQAVVNAADGLTDAEYCIQAWAWFQKLKTLGTWDAFIVQSWASTQPASTGPRTVPHNLPEDGDPTSHTSLLRRVLEAS